MVNIIVVILISPLILAVAAINAIRRVCRW